MTIVTGDQPENSTSQQPSSSGTEEKWGYDLYPERRGGTFERHWGRFIFGLEGRENTDKLKCENKVYKCIKTSPIVKLMMGALKSSGW